MTLTVSQQAELEKAVTRVAYFAEFDFSNGVLRLSSFNQTVSWGGYDWIGLGAMANISEVVESDSMDAKALNFTLNAADPDLIALAVGPAGQYRGRNAKLYMCPLDEQFRLVDTPTLCWRGQMDTMSVGIEGEQGSIILKCETAAYGLLRSGSLRRNAAQHKKIHPNDTGFDYLSDLIATPQIWVSKRFQTVD